jgi:hypothetical protein
MDVEFTPLVELKYFFLYLSIRLHHLLTVFSDLFYVQLPNESAEFGGSHVEHLGATADVRQRGFRQVSESITPE